MRAARVLEMLLVLQRRGRTTARELADILEVSERTILRDVEALGEAGVPIYATRGLGGGIDLIDGFRTNLTGFTPDEADVLFLSGQPALAHRLGLGAPARSVHEKLLNALPASLAQQADGLSDWFLHDPDPWWGTRIPHGELRRLARCIRKHRVVEITIGAEPTVVVRPLGLVLKSGSWHLVGLLADGDGSVARPTVICLDELSGTRIRNTAFTRPPDFDLVTFWERQLSPAAE